jgi:hypothetical protein
MLHGGVLREQGCMQVMEEKLLQSAPDAKNLPPPILACLLVSYFEEMEEEHELAVVKEGGARRKVQTMYSTSLQYPAIRQQDAILPAVGGGC